MTWKYPMEAANDREGCCVCDTLTYLGCPGMASLARTFSKGSLSIVPPVAIMALRKSVACFRDTALYSWLPLHVKHWSSVYSYPIVS